MLIKTGLVKYKDREDIMCTYGVMDDGKQYYFLDASDHNTLSNGNRIASTALIEAVDPMVRASNIGVIDEDGKEIIAFNNKAIKLISDGILLVESSVPTTASVVEANKEKSNPEAAARLVSTSAQIKEKMNKKMGTNGRYVFNDQFSEATLYDEDGNNLVNGEYFSFIGVSDGKLYLSKNVVDSPISVYSISKKDASNPIDIGQVEVSKQAIENALDVEKTGEKSSLESLGDDSSLQTADNELDFDSKNNDNIEAGVEADDNIIDKSPESKNKIDENDDIVPSEIKVESEPQEKESEETQPLEDVKSQDVVEDDDSNFLSTTLETSDEDNNGELSKEEDKLVDSFDDSLNIQSDFDDDNLYDDIDDSEIDYDDTNINFNDIKVDSIYNNLEDSMYDTHEATDTESIMDDLAKSMSGLLKQNRSLKESLANCEKKMSVYQHRIRVLEQKNATLSNKFHKLESSIKSLEEKVRSQSQIIDSQSRELKSLRPQGNLYKLLEDAHTILEEDNY